MEQPTVCARCRETIVGEPVVKQGKSYCTEACAFEATERPKPKACAPATPDSPPHARD